MEEEKLHESKVCNVIIYNVSEPNNHNRTERQKYDENFCLETFNKILKVSVARSDMRKPMRLGKYTSTSVTTGNAASAPRPILIQFRDRILKNQIMESLSNLKGRDDIYDKLIFVHDLRPQEREECKKTCAGCKKQEMDDN